MMKRQNIPPEDDYEIRCPRLGHQISFSYCRSENRGLGTTKMLSLLELIEQAKKGTKEE
jgi:hypothetical protein